MKYRKNKAHFKLCKSSVETLKHRILRHQSKMISGILKFTSGGSATTPSPPATFCVPFGDIPSGYPFKQVTTEVQLYRNSSLNGFFLYKWHSVWKAVKAG